jgi:bifunctional enzyme CysN/CysC
LLRNIKWERSTIPAEVRGERFNQKPALIIITGKKDSGKKTLARKLEESLYEAGKNVYFLGIGNVLYGVDADIKGIHDDRHEHIRRLAEVAHLMLDAGMIFIVTAIELTQKELELIKTTVDSECIQTVWIGNEPPSNIQFDVVIKNPDLVENAITRLTTALNL